MSRKMTFISGGQWYKGNTHLHTTRSDGTLEPEAALEVYRQAGYAFVAVTDHWYYGGYPECEGEGFIVIPGLEMDIGLNRGQGFCHHVTAMADPSDTPYKNGDRLEAVRALGDMGKMVEAMNKSNHICIYAHPAWSHVQMPVYEQVEGCVGVEIYNHVTERVWGCGYAEAYFDTKLWKGVPFLAFASDDAHAREHYIGGFIHVKALSLTHKDILDAIRQGSFYASNGPEIFDFYIEDGAAHVECSPCSEIDFLTGFNNGYRAAHMQPGTTRASWKLPEGANGGIYAVCRDGAKKAWSQPVFI